MVAFKNKQELEKNFYREKNGSEVRKLLKLLAVLRFFSLSVLLKKSMTNLDSILKSRDITLLREVCTVKAMVFPVVMNGCELDHTEQ